jgi:hypothetical protein
LRDADYRGDSTIDGQVCERWHIKGSFTDNDLYTTVTDRIPRRLDEGGSQITDYILSTFTKGALPDSVFAAPSYCNVAKPTNCPLTSVCGLLRKEKIAVQ